MRWAALLLLLGCAVIPSAPRDAEPIAPLPEYVAWYAEVAACAGLSGDPTLLRYYRVPLSYPDAPGFACGDGTGACLGEWRPPHAVYLSDASRTNRHVVQHEMLHDLTRGADHHPPVFARCAP